MKTELIAILIFLALTAADSVLGVLVSTVKLKQAFSLQKLVHQLEAQGSLLLAQLGGLIAQSFASADSAPSTALVSLVYAAAVAGSANLLKDCVNKLVALLGGASAPAATSGPQGSATVPPAPTS